MVKRIALVAHDSCKHDMMEWAKYNRNILKKHMLIATGTTGKLVQDAINEELIEEEKVHVRLLKSGPLGGDQQLGSMICNEEVDMVIFFWDPMSQQPHDVDIKALLRITVLYNIPMACNRSTADFLISSHLFHDPYNRKIRDYSSYLNRKI
ncbi:methylglyoxal synthase [Bacteroidales bacterium OttesenSCG-928-C19]|nr:methylglyoxal synthase [Bacteroidales bacterium OttesenSCG-928-C19]